HCYTPPHPLPTFPTRRSSDLFAQADLLALAGYGDAQRRGFFSRSEIEGRYLYIDPATFRPDESVDGLQDRFRRGALEQSVHALRSEEHTSELQSRFDLVCRLL